MPSLKNDFDELMDRVKLGRELTHASFEPIYYLVFAPQQILDVKRELPAWTAKLRNDGWEVTRFSIAEVIAELFAGAPLRKLWLGADRGAPLNWKRTNEALANFLSQGVLQARLASTLASLDGHKNSILLVTDLEALHPYLRIGAIESSLEGKFRVPTVFLYPGLRTGKTRLKFLGFYHEDGNYRSVHVGG
ncbi:MAG TPA: BREX protein BrxB domain-containing protein [Tepidisphaeraceae bacterium]|nr:BREX protein BrxB domain-containing protein [Tepidisphaeraceae bacterium]